MVIRKNDSGRSIVEMLGVLAIMGVITVMGISGYSQATEKIKRNGTVESITKIVQEVRSLYATSDNYSDLNNEKLQGIGLNLKGPYGNVITVSGVNSDSANPGFSISIPNIPNRDCVYYKTMKWSDVMSNEISTPVDFAYFGAGSPDTNGMVAAVTGNQCQSGLSVMTLYYR